MIRINLLNGPKPVPRQTDWGLISRVAGAVTGVFIFVGAIAGGLIYQQRSQGTNPDDRIKALAAKHGIHASTYQEVVRGVAKVKNPLSCRAAWRVSLDKPPAEQIHRNMEALCWEIKVELGLPLAP
jgi:hypothetical protein